MAAPSEEKAEGSVRIREITTTPLPIPFELNHDAVPRVATERFRARGEA